MSYSWTWIWEYRLTILSLLVYILGMSERINEWMLYAEGLMNDPDVDTDIIVEMCIKIVDETVIYEATAHYPSQ